jgi:toxin ParE1/3/4
MSQYRISDAAKDDLSDTWSYIAENSAAAADRVTAGLVEMFSTLAAFPAMGRRRDELGSALRSFVVGSYLIFYQPVEDGIEVIRVIHGSRDIDSLFRE